MTDHAQSDEERATELVGLLAQLIREEGLVRAATRLGVSYTTLHRALRSNRLGLRLRTALELHQLKSRACDMHVPDSPDAMRLSDLEKRLAAVEGQVRLLIRIAESVSRSFRQIAAPDEADTPRHVASRTQRRDVRWFKGRSWARRIFNTRLWRS